MGLTKASIQTANLVFPQPSCSLCLTAPFILPRVVLFACTVCLHVCGCDEGLHELHHVFPWVCMWLLAPLQAHWRFRSHQDVPTGPSLGRVPGLSPACVLAECFSDYTPHLVSRLVQERFSSYLGFTPPSPWLPPPWSCILAQWGQGLYEAPA